MQIRIKKYLIAATALAFTGTLSLPIQAQSAAANYPNKTAKTAPIHNTTLARFRVSVRNAQKQMSVPTCWS